MPIDATPEPAEELRAAITGARSQLVEVLYARARSLDRLTGWVGPHRERYDEEATRLLEAGRALDASLASLLYALDTQLRVLEEPGLASDGPPPDEGADTAAGRSGDGRTADAAAERGGRGRGPDRAPLRPDVARHVLERRVTQGGVGR